EGGGEGGGGGGGEGGGGEGRGGGGGGRGATVTRARRCARRRTRPGARRRLLQSSPGHRMTIREAREAVRTGARSAAEICREALERIDSSNGVLNAFNTLAADRALSRAEAIDRDPERWRPAPLAGVPIAIKDNICTRGLR